MGSALCSCSAARSLALLCARSLAICAFCSGVNSGCLAGASGSVTPLTSCSRASSSSSTSSSSWFDILFARSSLISCSNRGQPAQHLYKERCHAHLLVCPRLGVLAQQLLHVLYAAHFLLDLLQHSSTLLQPIQHIFLHKRKLDIACELLQLRQLCIGLLNQSFLVLLAPERQLGSVCVALGQAFLRDRLLTVGQHGNTLLVLSQLIALVLHVQDRPAVVNDAPKACHTLTHLSWAEILFELPEFPILAVSPSAHRSL